MAGLEWDELCPRELVHKSQEWFCELKDLPTIKVPRCLRFGQEQVVLSETLHTFFDASQDAYGAVVYLKVSYESGSVSSRLVAAKTRVAPLAATSITDGSNPRTKVDRVSFQSLQWWIGPSSLLV